LKLSWAFFAGIAVALTVACGDDDDGTPSVAAGVTEVVRQVVAEAGPEEAPGQVLELTRVIIPGNEGIPPHTHPGPQLAIIVEGSLTYTIIEGEATVSRAAATDGEKVETYGSGETVELRAGDSVTEPAGMVHMAENETDEPVVIYVSSLFPEGEPPATNVQ
jgi:quercetin dioxygenase-like cupin family protein